MPINFTKDGQVAIFEISNGKVNPTTPQMHREMHEALQAFEQDGDLKVGIMTGAGNRAFCAGDDIKTELRLPPLEERVYRHFYPFVGENDEGNYPGWERIIFRQRRFKPIVAAVNGWCLGQGMFYLMHLTDIRIAGKGAKFGFPEIAYGMGGGGGMTRLYRHIPRVDAMKMVLTGDPVDAPQALTMHILNEVVEDDQVHGRAREIADRIACHPLLAIRAEMEAFVRGPDLDDENAYAMADHIFRIQRLADDDSNPSFQK